MECEPCVVYGKWEYEMDPHHSYMKEWRKEKLYEEKKNMQEGV